MTDKRKLFWGFTAFIFGIDVAIHFYGEFQNFLTVANEPPGWPRSFSWLVYALAIVAWNTFIGVVGIIASPFGIVVLASLVWGYFETRPLRPPKS